MNNSTRRWIILFAGILANMCQGAAYASSVFAKPLLTHLNILTSTQTPDMTKWAMVFSFNLACLPLGMLISGKLADVKSSRIVIFGGGIIFGLGMFLAGYANSLAWLLVTFGIMMGIGSGAAYGAIVSTAVRWFPDMRGLASGLAVAALGAGTLVIAPIAHGLLGHAPEGEIPILWIFKILGIAFIVIIVSASFLLKAPPEGYAPEGWTPKKTSGAAPAAVSMNWIEMLKKPEFWLLFIMYACGAFSGLMIISQASPIAQKMARLTPADAVLIVMFIGLANALGRVMWGFISDKIGRLNALLTMFAVTAIAMFLLPEMSKEKTSLLIDVMIIGTCFGGYLGTFPSVCADYFGTKHLTVNYALLFSAFSVAAIIGPRVAGEIAVKTGTYIDAFIIAAIVSIVGTACTVVTIILAKLRARKQQAA